MSMGTKVELGGKERFLRYTLRSVVRMGEVLGIEVRLAHLGEDLMEVRLPLSAMEVVIWGGLLHAEPDLRPEDVGDWIDESNWQEIFKVFLSRFSVTSPDTQAQVMRAFGQEETTTEASAEMPEPATLAS